MTLFLSYSDPRGIDQPAALVALGSNIRFGDLGLSMSAELGEPDLSTLSVDDPGGIYNFVGLRAFDVRETAAASNNQVVGRFVIQDRTVARSPERGLLTGADRLWTINLADYNWHIGQRVFVDADANRPVETAGNRLRWLLASAAHINLNDYGHVTYPTAQLDAHDYRGEDPGVLLADCAIEDQYTFWVDFNEAHGTPELFFLDPDGTSYASGLAISNHLDDIDSIVTFAPYSDAELGRSPDRVAGGVFLPYTGGYVYARSTATATNFALVDRVAPMATVHTEPRARRLAAKFLAVNNEEDDRITCAVKVPAANVNDIRHGHRLFVRFTDLPGYEIGRWTRVMRRAVAQEAEGGGSYYRIALELVPSGTYPPVTTNDYTGDVFAGLQRSRGFGPVPPLFDATKGPLGYTNDYASHPAPGWGSYPTTGPIVINQTSAPYRSVTVSASMTVRIHARVWLNEVLPVTNAALNVRVNGIIVGQHLRSVGPGVVQVFLEVDLRNYHLSAGDVVSADSVGSAGGHDDLRWDNSGTGGTYLKVGRGDLSATAAEFIGP